MLYIDKQKASPRVLREIARVKSSPEWSSSDKMDTSGIRAQFDSLDKSVFREQLYREQKGLCAYCMKRVRNDGSSVIEHYLPVDENRESALDYENMMLCCDGGRSRTDGNHHILCCNASKGHQTITISPYNESQMSKIRYNKNGKIYTYPQDQVLEHDINQVLHLNGIVDKEGNCICDTSTELVYGRKKVFESFRTYIEGLDRKKKCTRSVLEKKRKEIADSVEMIEFAGVWLYFLDRKLKKLQ